MYSFMGGGLFCAGIGNILLIVSTATDYWMQYRHSSNYMHQGLWRYCVPGKCMTHTDSIAYWDATRAFMILSLLACFFGIVIGVMAFIRYSSFDGFDKTFAAGILFFISCFFVLLAMAVYTGVTVNYYGKRYGSWRFSWSYIMGWVAVVLMFFSGMHPDISTKANTQTCLILMFIILLFSSRYLLHVCLPDARMPKKL
ncbi:lens intrinsic membrane protein 2.3 isoform X1 [Larimichthys crocea]|uniref:lens intrinsic membrane protein 2.3 isoform X1 n=1 Tax=Larimichthys crocea TaxID=215358 RepID=UPI000F5DF83E|nr:lens fiber membrane intrinsic protein isoform X1 [Larimichthys crocea]XP_027136537.1 lens fiber membrane intrinsic protein isoform X1 [Larimichthys crocea]